MAETKTDKLIWWLMITFALIIIGGGGAWAADITRKVSALGETAARVPAIESNVSFIRSDISEIRNLIITYIEKGD